MDRIVFLNWHWKFLSKTEFFSENCKDLLLLSNINNSVLFNSYIKSVLDYNKPSMCLILSHNHGSIDCSIPKNNIKYEGDINPNIVEFGWHNSLTRDLYYGDLNKNGLFHPDEKIVQIHLENFEKVWNKYYILEKVQLLKSDFRTHTDIIYMNQLLTLEFIEMVYLKINEIQNFYNKIDCKFHITDFNIKSRSTDVDMIKSFINETNERLDGLIKKISNNN
ncbi:MAG TPA: hypothetical protein VFF33_08745 [Ignavibacteriaceae bacterium]|jgi:hypothetical protein|nr:hypothetical protein [Ignavibacteriaceae bacterium]